MFIKWHHFAIWMTFKYYYCCNIELTHVRFGQIFKFKCPTFTLMRPQSLRRLWKLIKLLRDL